MWLYLVKLIVILLAKGRAKRMGSKIRVATTGNCGRSVFLRKERQAENKKSVSGQKKNNYSHIMRGEM
jgi:hypothetical protein